MNIKQLKEIIASLPDNMDVFVGERLTTFSYGLVNSASVKEICFFEDGQEGDPDDCAKVDALVLEED